MLGFTTAVKKHHDRKQQAEKSIYSPYSSISLLTIKGNQVRNSIRAGSLRQELMQGP